MNLPPWRLIKKSLLLLKCELPTAVQEMLELSSPERIGEFV
jgi:hypothetical protein